MFKNMFAGLTGMIIFISAAAALAQGNQDSTQNLQQFYMEYQQISQRIQSVQQKALADSEIAEKSKIFSDKLDSAIIKENPSDKEKLAKRDKIISNFQDAQQKGDKEKMLKLQQDYKNISMELQVHQQKVMENEELRKEGIELNNELLKKMTSIDPGVPKLMKRLEFLGKKLQQGMQEKNKN
ncbi:MAG: hypothetical protein P8Z35_15375 [Ignavibacteriaceae bacterium]|jgi:chromosome condensin MukBEF ATPase and DNA-binding subunit MukB